MLEDLALVKGVLAGQNLIKKDVQDSYIRAFVDREGAMTGFATG